MGNRRLLALLAAAALGSAACDDAKKPATQVRLHGRMTFEGGAYLPGVTITARCGGTQSTATAGDMGDYEVEIPTSGCDRLVFEYTKESYGTTYRSLALPTTRSSVQMDVSMGRMGEIICGQFDCSVESDDGSYFANASSVFARGWIATYGEQAEVPFYPGEFFDTSGRPLLLLQTRITDFRDKPGNQIPILSEGRFICTPLDPVQLDELQDVKPKAQFPDNPGIDAVSYTIDSATGRWTQTGDALVIATGQDCNENIRTGDIPEEALGDVRRNADLELSITLPPVENPQDPCARFDNTVVPPKLVGEIVDLVGRSLCGAVPGSNVYGYGYSQAGKTCVVVEVENGCGGPDPEATVEMLGNDRSFYNWGPTDDDGRTCLEAHRSERIAESQTMNNTEGETFWVNLKVSATGGVHNFEGVAMPTTDGSCDRPSTCERIVLVPPSSGNCAEIPSLGQADGGTADAGAMAPDPEGPVRLQAK